jgi:hypothetical protein
LQSVVTAELQVILAALDLEEACGPQAPPTGEAES